MSENTALSAENVEKIKQAANEFKTTVLNYFKDRNVEVKEWKFAMENSEEAYIIDVAAKIVIKPKPKPSE